MCLERCEGRAGWGHAEPRIRIAVEGKDVDGRPCRKEVQVVDPAASYRRNVMTFSM